MQRIRCAGEGGDRAEHGHQRHAAQKSRAAGKPRPASTMRAEMRQTHRGAYVKFKRFQCSGAIDQRAMYASTGAVWRTPRHKANVIRLHQHAQIIAATALWRGPVQEGLAGAVHHVHSASSLD